MATFESIGLAIQLSHNICGLIRDMRDNATGYKAQVVSQGVVQISTVMKNDANQYIRRIGWITSLSQRNLAKFDAALSAFGLTRAEAVALRDTLLTVANHTKDAILSTDAEVNAEADYILSNVPEHERLW